ncbi:MAG: hypothetical protein IPP13_18830 [Kouleothrix sp.]|jgi:hypothetical protein|nr:hypothetical protein [Kouleothrix sp.]
MNLEAKFTQLETQLNAQHTALINALNALLSALGAPPPAPGATLADVLGALNALNLVLTGLRTDMADQHAALLNQLELQTTTLELLNSNQSLNAQRMLVALSNLDPCKTCDVPALDIPPIDATPRPVDQEHCKRAQALIYAIKRFLVKLDVLSSFGIGFSAETIKNAYTEVITELGVTENLVLPSFVEIAQLVGACVAYVVSNVFAGNSLVAGYTAIESDLLAPLYAATSAEGGKAAYITAVQASLLPGPVKAVLIAAAYTALFNLYYDNTIALELTGYDGTICAPAGPANCTVLVSVVDNVLLGGSVQATRHAIAWPSGYTAGHDQPNGYSHSETAVLLGNYEGFRVRKVSGDAIRLFAFGAAGNVVIDVPIAPYVGESYFVLPVATASVVVDSYGSDTTEFSIELCPPLAS